MLSVMELGDVSQLKTYARAMRNCSDDGNHRGVEMFGKLICNIAAEKKELAFSRLDIIMARETHLERDKRNARTFKDNIEEYNGWIEDYSPDSPKYAEMMSQAEVNSWKQGDDGTSFPELGHS